MPLKTWTAPAWRHAGPWRLSCRRRAVQGPVAIAGSDKFDVLVLDATNVLSGAAAADRRRLVGLPGHNLKTAFADWVAFLKLVAEPSTLVVACFDAPKGQRGGAGKRGELAKSYLQRRRRQQEAQAARAPGSGMREGQRPRKSGGDTGLYPFLDYLKGLGAVSIVAQDGWEADDCVGAACALLEGCCPSLSIAVASGDGDTQQLLSAQVSWLQLLPAPTLQQPLGLEFVSRAEFEEQHGFPPQTYPEWLAFVGKRDSSIGGVGTGASTAAKLLKRYGSIAGIEAAAGRGELAGWSPAAQRLFSTDPAGHAQRQLLHRNQQLFTINCSAGLLREEQREEILSRAGQLIQAKETKAEAASNQAACSSGDNAGELVGQLNSGASPLFSRQGSRRLAELAWAHPLHATRWRYVEQYTHQLAAQLQAQGAVAEPKATTLLGLAVDILVHTGSGQLGIEEDGKVAVVVAGVADFHKSSVGSSSSSNVDPNAGEGLAYELASAAKGSRALVQQLNGAMQHHVRLLKKEGLQVVCIPWWWLLQDQ